MTRKRRAALALIATAALAAMLALAGCAKPIPYTSEQTRANRTACGGGADCHGKAIDAQAASVHEAVACDACHQGTGEQHASDPKKNVATTDWRIDSCSGCHSDEASTYLYDDNAQVGPFGGSQRIPPQPKADTFPEYDTIVAGHAFTKDYNEEGAHTYLLEDHYATKRGKFETCMQCKSTKVALAFKDGRELRVAKDTDITLKHTASPGVPAKVVKIPEGTVITYKTDLKTRYVDAKATFPDGTVWTSKPAASEDATKNYNMVWASTVAATMETWPYGAGCNHCHDPHTGEQRLVRKSMLDAIEEKGVNPYAEGSTKDWTEASAQDKRDLTCAQCHVEYTCGKSGVDKIDRDAFGWAKAKDLHAEYTKQFEYKQDWKQAVIGEPLIKSQHPETELFWESKHYAIGASCADCHMPEMQGASGKTFRSHWFTSPYKYADEKLLQRLRQATGAKGDARHNPCARCHADRVQMGIAQQKAFYARQAVVEKLLAKSVNNLGAMKSRGGTLKDPTLLAATIEAHRKAHVLWENIAVSENSMGFHNFEEAMSSMDEAEKQLGIALQNEARALH